MDKDGKLRDGKKSLPAGIVLVLVFIAWTLLVCTVDLQPIGVNGTDVGFGSINGRFHSLTGVHFGIYTVTDWLGLVPIFICMGFGVLGLCQWIARKNIMKVDADILLLGGYYIIVICAYVLFEMLPVNYRPVLINGAMESSFPSSTVLLVLSVMPTLVFQIMRRTESKGIRIAVVLSSALFSLFMMISRLLAGVHWFTDIIGALLLSSGLFLIYRGLVYLTDRRKKKEHYGIK